MSPSIVSPNLAEPKTPHARDQLRASMALDEVARWNAQLDRLRWHQLSPDRKHFYKERAKNAVIVFARVWGDAVLMHALGGAK